MYSKISSFPVYWIVAYKIALGCRLVSRAKDEPIIDSIVACTPSRVQNVRVAMSLTIPLTVRYCPKCGVAMPHTVPEMCDIWDVS